MYTFEDIIAFNNVMELYKVITINPAEESDEDITKPPKRHQQARDPTYYILNGVCDINSFQSLVKKQHSLQFRQEVDSLINDPRPTVRIPIAFEGDEFWHTLTGVISRMTDYNFRSFLSE
jgi:hypothetical protein